MQHIQFSFLIFILFFITSIDAQQGYSGNKLADCDRRSRENPLSPSYLYTCNGLSRSCQAFLIFKSQPNFNSVASISRLFGSDPLELARINNISDSYASPANKEVIIPVNCSCAGQYYQANTSYVINDTDTYYTLSTDRYQGLSSCSALLCENPYEAENLSGGLNLVVPLRCACPTRNQTEDGTKYLLTYSINENDTVSALSERFNVSEQKTAFANGFTEQDAVIEPSTTVLIPLPRKPLSSQTIIFHPIEYTPPTSIIFMDKRSNTRLLAGIGVGVVSVVVILLSVTVFLWLRRRNSKRIKRKKQTDLSKDILNEVNRIDRVLKVFQVEELKEATKDFSSECRIQGSVYRGIVGSSVFAIKKVSRGISQEANILHKLNHFNLISLCGIGRGEHFYLVYEYMENGSLKDWLQDPNRFGHLKWTQRVQIALDIASGLDYLHNFTYPPYVHKDIKSSNVLLNGKLRAKITNFSLARSSDRTLTENLEGTLGYMAPEYLESGIVSPKLDVYAFGVVMAELITGRDVINEYEGRDELLPRSIVDIMEGRNVEKKLADFMESATRSTSPIGLVMEVAKLCVACLTKDRERRPNLHEVILNLSRIQRYSQMWALTYQ